MYLQQITLKNFRCFKDLTLILNQGLNILVGENDSGKSTVIDAVRCVLGTNSSDRIFLEEADFHTGQTSLSIELKFVNVDKHAHVFVEHLTHEEDPFDKAKRHSALYVHLFAENTGLEKRGYPHIKTEVKSGKGGVGTTIEAEIRRFLSTTYLKPLRDAEAEMSSGKGSRLAQILNSSRELVDQASVNQILDLIAQTNAKLLDEDGPISKTSQRIQEDYLYQLIFERDKSVLRAIIDIAGIKSLDDLTDIQKRRYLRAILEAFSLSLTDERRKHGLGYNNLLFMATELLLLEQESDTEFPLLLIEEPEAHLHPQLQMKLLQFITSKSKSAQNPSGIQCILTTHSPNISSKADPQNIIIINQGKVFSLRSDETELKPSDYVFLQKFLDVTKANLFFARAVILVEGDAENILLPTIAKILGRPLENYGVSVINIGNTAWKRFAKLFLRNGKDSEPGLWNPIKVAVLRDLDLWPDCAEEKEENRYGFKERKPRNARYWLSNVTDIDTRKAEMKSVDTDEDEDRRSLERQNVRVCISDHWTFEYCLAYCGLFDECYEALNGSTSEASSITGRDEEKATYVMSKVDKTDFAYNLVSILETKYADNPEGLRTKLPPYIVDALEFVTDPFPLPLS